MSPRRAAPGGDMPRWQNDAMGAIESVLLARLAGLAAEEQSPEALACIGARRAHGVKSVDIDAPLLGILVSGSKRVQGEGVELAIEAGTTFVVRSGRFDIINRPPDGGQYLTLAVTLCEEVLAAARLLWAAPPAGTGPAWALMPTAALHAPLEAWGDAMAAGQHSAARLALASLLLRFCEAGHAQLLRPPPPTLAARIRAQVGVEPARDWRSVDLEVALNLSGATLRRHLAAEGTSLREVIADARLSCAMQLLYTTGWPLKTIAARVGYRSAATFSRRFAGRFGLQPADIGRLGGD